MTAIEWRQLTVPDAAALGGLTEQALPLAGGLAQPAEKCDNAGISGG
jgi:hypothetical protein